ncbi:hypothetical protein [Streptomyces sp. WMMC1477]|uniref:hypothetical protein n=1 Tax=Streptomyces sp. WMMC1477 TaxID=3015155 RepID=UPI0022B69999|nr:hypothetical protein [Streptomyces sp. WMMC1477]MCZ7433351.1 hypothetical protein [Streptomyces sp. WMMC1477]
MDAYNEEDSRASSVPQLTPDESIALELLDAVLPDGWKEADPSELINYVQSKDSPYSEDEQNSIISALSTLWGLPGSEASP